MIALISFIALGCPLMMDHWFDIFNLVAKASGHTMNTNFLGNECLS